MITQTYDFEDIKIWSERKSFKQINGVLLTHNCMFSILIESKPYKDRIFKDNYRILDNYICGFLNPGVRIVGDDSPFIFEGIGFFNPYYESKTHSLANIKQFYFNSFKNKLKFINICSSILLFT